MKKSLALPLFFFALTGLVNHAHSQEIEILRAPEGGFQPLGLYSPDGKLHLIYYRPFPSERKKKAAIHMQGELVYVARANNQWSKPITIVAVPGSAPSMRPKMLMDHKGRLHIMAANMKQSVYQYVRSNPERTSFRARPLRLSQSLEANADMAISGNKLYFIWSAGSGPEFDRHLQYLVSSDLGETLERTGETELAIQDLNLPKGVCMCCTGATVASPTGDIHYLYRNIAKTTEASTLEIAPQRYYKDMYLATITPDGKVSQTFIDAWGEARCPGSTSAMAFGPKGKLWMAWETKKTVYLGALGEDPIRIGEKNFPSFAIDGQGRMLVAWKNRVNLAKKKFRTTVEHRLLDANRSTLREGKALTALFFDTPIVLAKPSGGFLLLY